MKRYLAIVNPAAGGGRCGKLASQTLGQIRAGGLAIEVAETRRAGDATALAREGYEQGLSSLHCRGRRRDELRDRERVVPTREPDGQGRVGISPLGDREFFSARLYRAGSTTRYRGHHQTEKLDRVMSSVSNTGEVYCITSIS